MYIGQKLCEQMGRKKMDNDCSRVDGYLDDLDIGEMTPLLIIPSSVFSLSATCHLPTSPAIYFLMICFPFFLKINLAPTTPPGDLTSFSRAALSSGWTRCCRGWSRGRQTAYYPHRTVDDRYIWRSRTLPRTRFTTPTLDWWAPRRDNCLLHTIIMHK